jgi:hypothetical protein
MTIQDLRRIVLSSQQQEQNSNSNKQMQQLLLKVRDKPFWLWTRTEDDHEKRRLITKGNCCFTHIIGQPLKHGRPQPFWNYQHAVFRALFEPSYINFRPPTEEEREKYNKLFVEAELKSQSKEGSIKKTHQNVLAQKTNELIYPFKAKHIAILKASKIGISELCLRICAWLCTKNNNLQGSQMIIFTGPRLELAVSLIDRLKGLFRPHGITFQDKETVCNLNGVRIEAFPSHHADSARGLPNVSLILADECSFFPDREKDNVMDIILRYVPASNPYLIAVSTPQKPGDFMDQIMKEPYEQSPWKKVMLHYSEALGKMYTQEEIDKVKNSRSFAREFCLQFAGLEGNCVSESDLQTCIKTGEILNETAPIDDWSIQTQYVMSIDIGWGSSNTAIMVSRFVNGKAQIVYSREFVRPLFQDIINEIWKLKRKCGDNLKNILIDASATELYTGLCNEFNQNPSLQYLRDKQVWVRKVKSDIMKYLFVVPIPFNPQGKTMLNHTQRMLSEKEDDGTALVGIHKQFEDLITSCRSAYASNDVLDKERTVHADTFDALRMNLQYYSWRSNNK